MSRLRRRWYRWRFFRYDDGNGGVKDHPHYDVYELVGLDGKVDDVRCCRHCLAHQLIENYLWGWAGYVRRAPRSRRRIYSRMKIFGRGPYPLPPVWGSSAPACAQPYLAGNLAGGER